MAQGNRRRSRSVPIWAAVLVFLATFVGSALYVFSLPDTYTAEAVVQFSPRTNRAGAVISADSVNSAAAGYVAYLGAPSTVDAVAQQIGTTPEDLASQVTVTLLPDTTTVSIIDQTTDPKLAADGAAAMAAAAVARAKDDPLVVASVLAPPAVPQHPSGPPSKLILAAGLLLGVLLGALAYLLAAALLTRRASRREASQEQARREASSGEEANREEGPVADDEPVAAD